MPPPIIFCHYGDTRYLRYTLAAAVRTNPDRKVVLLGDNANAWLARHLPIEHVLFDSLDYGPELADFDRVYRAIQGPRHVPVKGGRNWLNFVFRRWFFVLNYLRATNTGAFWHFDSDTMLLRPLAQVESRFAEVPCTEQCEGTCLNGWVSGPELVQRYVTAINEIFTRQAYLAAQQREFNTVHPNWAFTEMRAWAIFRDEQSLATVPLSHEHAGAIFDDCICHDHGFEMELLRHGQPVKRVWLGLDGSFWVRRAADETIIRLNSLNLSWVPDYLFHQVAYHLRNCTGQESVDGLANIAGCPTLARRAVPLRFLVEGAQAWTKVCAKRLLRRRVIWP